MKPKKSRYEHLHNIKQTYAIVEQGTSNSLFHIEADSHQEALKEFYKNYKNYKKEVQVCFSFMNCKTLKKEKKKENVN